MLKVEKKRQYRHNNFTTEQVATLKAWLNDNCFDPYPNVATKTTLSKETGLTYDQVQHWFINARLRILKKSKATNPRKKVTIEAKAVQTPVVHTLPFPIPPAPRPKRAPKPSRRLLGYQLASPPQLQDPRPPSLAPVPMDVDQSNTEEPSLPIPPHLQLNFDLVLEPVIAPFVVH